MAVPHVFTVEPLGADLQALAQCLVLEATALPTVGVRFGFEDPTAVTWVARRVGNVCGFASAVRIGVGLHLTALAVEPSLRRRGNARALLRAAAAETREIRLEVWVGNLAAFELYRSEGFVVEQMLPNFYAPALYGSSRDAFLMVRRRPSV